MLRTSGQLASANTDVLASSYSAARHDAVVAEVWLVVCALVLLSALIALQVMLWRTMRRILNPALLGATAIALALIVGAFATTSDATHQLKVARYDAFDSLSRLEQARAVSSNANADKSRYLLTMSSNPQAAQSFYTSYLTESQQLANLPPATLDNYADLLLIAVLVYQWSGSEHTLHFTGLLGDEMRNLTFPGEQDAAVQALTAYQVYQNDDQTLRGDLSDGNPYLAIGFDTNSDPGSSDGDFNAYEQSLQNVIAINQKAFDAAIDDGTSTLSGWSGWLPYTAFVLILALVLVGVRPRLAEYR
jgi:hypothetical protein